MLLCLLSIFDRNWSSQVKFWLNWGCHNNLKIEKQVPNHIQPQNLLTSVINMSASNSTHIKFSMYDFKILFFFEAIYHPPFDLKLIG